jgi:hypothetical protein
MSCNSSGSSSETVKDSVLENVDSTGDSTKEKVKIIKENLDSAFKRKDSIR